MKKLLFAMVVSALLIFAVATVASADNGPHGGFNGSTDACASCHRAHSAISSDGFLLVASDIYSLCTSCHDGTGAYTNVVDGYFDTSLGDPGKNAFGTSGQGDAGHGLFAGGFVNARMLTNYGNGSGAEGGLANPTTNTAAADLNTSTFAWARRNAYDATTGIPASRAVTSNHDVSTIGRAGTVWGSGNINGAGNLGNNWGAGSFTGATELECTSCHDPHGNAGRQGGLNTGAPYPSYRILRFQPSGSNGFEVTNASLVNTVGSGTTFTWNTAVVPDTLGVLVPDPAVSWYTPNTSDDGMVYALRGRVGSGEIFVANFAGMGDYMGRYYAYQRPAGAVTAATTGTILSCLNGGGVPTNPGTACGPTTGPTFNNVAAQDKLGYWCATCHDRYLAQGGTTRTTDSGDPGYHFRHRSQGNGTTAGQYTCVSCHNAHGTAATASSSLASAASYATGSVLLKGDNRAVCVRCHAGAINFFNVTTSPGAPMVLP